MLRRENKLEAIGNRRQISTSLFGYMGRMIIKNNVDLFSLGVGVCQDSCPVTFTMIYKLYSLARISLGGLSHTSFTGFQFLVLPDQRSGFFALVAS
uniref:Uncharacterized protein n=1 Tax=Candidatus Kentrum sp. LPFa TaxID=2126335 RepID=A0A450X5J9_9GAMM|nr:MAG: hypothetical protein BECKLPF1236A_GA0070988_104231 [Candidatus Kentron sp. LPFa]VFK36386.1 MAG: hypothetical protein BECKLPF1236C_GA0070990_105981 [Candidatus Kentron sp. LPFa]